MDADGDISFNFNQMLQGLQKYTDAVKQQLSQLESATGGTVKLGVMFKLQYRMQLLSQYTEAVSNVLTAVNQEMVGMARATKGQ